jgi:hypothetical protein
MVSVRTSFLGSLSSTSETPSRAPEFARVVGSRPSVLPALRVVDVYRDAAATSLPRTSQAATEVEAAAPTLWGRAVQLARSWFRPAGSAAMLGAGFIPSVLGYATPAMASLELPTLDPIRDDARTYAEPRYTFEGHELARATASEVLFGHTEPFGGSAMLERWGPSFRVADASGTITRTSGTAAGLSAVLYRPAAEWSPAAQPRVERGSEGPAVLRLQERLASLGYDVGTPDGEFGRRTRTAVLEYQFDHRGEGLRADGRVGQATWRALAGGQAMRAEPATTTPGGLSIRATYAPFASDTIKLFEEAATLAGVPRSWASSTGLHRILQRESHGEVGKPNYTYGSRAPREVHAELRAGIISARSSATGLGQLLLSNVELYYPSGRAGIGDPLEEAVGMLRYIEARYGSPSQAWASYGRLHEGY